MANTITVDSCRADETCDLQTTPTTKADLRIISEKAVSTAFDLGLNIVLTVKNGANEDTASWEVSGSKVDCITFEQTMKAYY